SATPTPGKSPAEVEAALRREMARVISDGVTEEELNRAKAQAIAANVFQRDSMFYQARVIGTLETAGISHKSIETQLRKLREITSEQVREVARKYFTDDALTIAYLDPQPVKERRPPALPSGSRHVQ
ncbi:MAG TPA: insulinase family protein, partial [Burkholderiales bacterium]|nr:insulinase family protein [Burkholderiales bacterium]